MDTVSIVNKKRFNYGCIFKIVFEDVEYDKDNKNQWILIFNGRRYNLNLLSLIDGLAEFENETLGKILLDSSFLYIDNIKYEIY